MLARLDPALLERLWFPLGELTKAAVRELARDAGLPVADKRESQDLCFLAGIGGRALPAAPRRTAPRRPARSWTATARVLGRHDGQHHFTVGQRRGLGVAAGEPLYVLEQGRRARTAWWSARASALATDRVRARRRRAAPRAATTWNA